MSEPNKRRPWFRVHLSTCIVLMFVAGCANTKKAKTTPTKGAQPTPPSVQTLNEGAKNMSADEFLAQVSDKTRELYAEISGHMSLPIVMDTSRRGGATSENVGAHFVFDQKSLETKIYLYEKRPKEETFVHELLHARYLLAGNPILFPSNGFGRNRHVPAGLEHALQHAWVFTQLEKLGYKPRSDENVERWKVTGKGLQGSTANIPAGKIESEMIIVGTTYVLSGFLLGLKPKEIRANMPDRLSGGFVTGKQVFDATGKHALDEIKGNMALRKEVATLFNFGPKQVAIVTVNFESRTVRFLDPQSGKLLFEHQAPATK